MALAVARLVAAPGVAERAVVSAMMQHPELVGGRRRLCTELMEAYPGRVLAKVGAEGVYVAALPDSGLGLCLKVEDGDAGAAMVALLAILDAIGLDPPPSRQLARFAELPVLNTRNEPVGSIRAAGELRKV
jgi:L-asparaginase II